MSDFDKHGSSGWPRPQALAAASLFTFVFIVLVGPPLILCCIAWHVDRDRQQVPARETTTSLTSLEMGRERDAGRKKLKKMAEWEEEGSWDSSSGSSTLRAEEEFEMREMNLVMARRAAG